MELSCARVKSEILKLDDAYVLLVAEDCPYCEQVLESVHKGNVNLDHQTFVINTDRCSGEVDSIFEWDATPMIVHLQKGKVVRKGRGLDGVLAFEKSKGAGNPVVPADETREEVKPEAPPTGMSVSDILRVAEQAPPVSVSEMSGVAQEQGQEELGEVPSTT